MKKIIIDEYLKFQYLDRELKKGLVIEPAYRTGYWNVFVHNAELEQFLIRNNIAHKVTEE